MVRQKTRNPLAPQTSVRLLGQAEVAAILQVSQPSVFRMRERGELPYLTAGKSVRFRRDVIDALLRGEPAARLFEIASTPLLAD